MTFGGRLLVSDFVVAGFATGSAVEESVEAHADFQLRIAEAAVTLTLALIVRHVALRAVDFLGPGNSGHIQAQL